jgi:hypothetical protein
MELVLSNQGTPVSCTHLTTAQAAAYLGISPRTLEDWRLTGFGPAFIKMGRRVLYRLHDLGDFIEARLRRNTGQH